MNVAEAVSWEDSPVAVARNVAPINSSEKMYQLVSNSPFSSATTSHGSNDCWIGVYFDHNHVHGFAGLEAGAVEIDIGKWRVILAIGGEGRLVVRRLAALGLTLGCLFGTRLVARLNTCEASGSYSFFAKCGRLTQGAFVGCR